MFEIRKYRSSDRERMRYIAMQTAWESYRKKENRAETVAIMYNDYFTQFEPDNIFVVADETDTVFGYIICSSDYDLFLEKSNHDLLSKAKKLYYPITFVQKMLCLSLNTIREKRVHIHIDLLPEIQHQGWGMKLLETLSDHLYKNGVFYMAASVSNRAASYQLCKKFGFETYKKLPFSTEIIMVKTREKENG